MSRHMSSEVINQLAVLHINIGTLQHYNLHAIGMMRINWLHNMITAAIIAVHMLRHMMVVMLD